MAVVWLLASCIPCWAQGNIRTVLFVRLKSGQDDNWKAAVKDYVGIVRKAGSDQAFTIWESQTGPVQYAVVWYSAKWKEMGEQNPKLKSDEADIARVLARWDGFTQSLDRWIDEMQPDLSIDSKEIPPMVRTSRTRVVPGKMDELKALFKDQVVPAIKKSGSPSYGFAVARFGTPTNEIHTYIGLNGWADLDEPSPAEKAMTSSEWKQFLTKISALTEGTEWTVWKFQSDLSYIPAGG